MPTLYSLSPSSPLIKLWPQGRFKMHRFANQELQVELLESPKDSCCLLLGTIGPPESNLLELAALAHTLKKEKAMRCIAPLPYLAYSRQDHPEQNKSQMPTLLGSILKTSGIDEIITLDIHNSDLCIGFPIPLKSLSCAELWKYELKRSNFMPDTLVAPDQGAYARCKELAKILNPMPSLAVMEKIRSPSGIIHNKLETPIGKKVLILDDILDTGQTLISATKLLLEKGALDIEIFVTHGLFTGHAWEALMQLGVKKIVCTNSLNHSPAWLQTHNIQEISIFPILKECHV